jgi:hypothetical protein
MTTPENADAPWLTTAEPCPSGHTDCTVDCGACKGTPTYGKSKSEERGEAHAIRAKAAEEGPQQEH